jgi:hypothetical protein
MSPVIDFSSSMETKQENDDFTSDTQSTYHDIRGNRNTCISWDCDGSVS